MMKSNFSVHREIVEQHRFQRDFTFCVNAIRTPWQRVYTTFVYTISQSRQRELAQLMNFRFPGVEVATLSIYPFSPNKSSISILDETETAISLRKEEKEEDI